MAGRSAGGSTAGRSTAGSMASHPAIADGNWHAFGASHSPAGSSLASGSRLAATNLGFRGGAFGWRGGQDSAGAAVGAGAIPVGIGVGAGVAAVGVGVGG